VRATSAQSAALFGEEHHAVLVVVEGVVDAGEAWTHAALRTMIDLARDTSRIGIPNSGLDLLVVVAGFVPYSTTM